MNIRSGVKFVSCQLVSSFNKTNEQQIWKFKET